jgi:hypothetical protein
MNPTQSTNGQPVDKFATISNVPIQPESDRVNPNQVASGLTRGAQLITGGDGYPQVLMGNQKSFGNGFYVAKPGHDVVANTDANNFIFNSNQNIFKVVKSGTTTITVPNPPVSGTFYRSVEVTHNLGYIPAAIAFVDPSPAYKAYALANGFLGTSAPSPWIATNTATAGVVPIIYIYFLIDISYVSTTGIKFFAQSAAADANYSGDWAIKYYLLQESST